jgi:hypothetical protein
MATKHNGKNIAVTAAAARAGQIALPGIPGSSPGTNREFAALEQAMEQSLADAAQSAERSLRIVSAPGMLRGILQAGNLTVRIDGKSFALSTREDA